MRISCAKPQVSAYDFMRYLCAVLAKKKKVIIDLGHIVDHLYQFKSELGGGGGRVFEDIEFRASVDSVVSYDVSESINSLQTFGMIGKLNPNYEKIVIYLTDADADEILKSCDPEVAGLISRLAETF